MKRQVRIQNLGGARAMILHRPHETVQALTRQLTAIGLVVSQVWPDPRPDVMGMDFVFFDADMGHDGQFPWAQGKSPMPMIALIGSEAPGRIEWALSAGAHAQMLKPVGGSGAYSALLIARASFDSDRRLSAEVADLRRRLDERRTVVRAVTHLMRQGATEDAAYDQLRRRAMDWRVTFEDAAARVAGRHDTESDDDRARRR
jgi:AmiR/NasT family two-component response regulator